jgi:hypothetical protein
VGLPVAFGYSEGPLKGETHVEPNSSTAHAVTDLWCSLECTPPCQGGGRGFKSRQVRPPGSIGPSDDRVWSPGRVAQ